MSETQYAYDPSQDAIIYRIPGHQHGDGQIDTEEQPVWLLWGSPDEWEQPMVADLPLSALQIINTQ